MPIKLLSASTQVDDYNLERVGGTHSFAFGGQTTNLHPSTQTLMSTDGTILATLSHAGLSTVTTGAETTLATFTLPAGTLDAVGRGINIQVFGSATFASGTAVVKVYFGSVGTTVGSLATTNVFNANLTIWKDAASSQTGIFTSSVATTAQTPVLLSQTETDTASIVLKVTGNQSAVASAIKINGFIITGYN